MTYKLAIISKAGAHNKMGRGFLIPISREMLGVAIVISIIVIFIYAIYYNTRKTSIRKIENKFNAGTANDPKISNLLSVLNVPELVEIYFKNRTIDFSNNTLIYYTDGMFAFALGSHKRLKVPKVFFRIDFSNNPIVHKLFIISDQEDKIAELYLTAESTIFSEGKIRYYEVSWSDLRKILNSTNFNFSIYESSVGLIKEEAEQIQRAIQFSLKLKSDDSLSLLARNE